MQYKVFIHYSNGEQQGVYVSADNESKVDIIGASTKAVSKYLDEHPDVSIKNINHTLLKARFEYDTNKKLKDDIIRVIDNDHAIIVEFEQGKYNTTAKVVSSPQGMGKKTLQDALNDISEYVAKYHKSDAMESDMESASEYVSRIIQEQMDRCKMSDVELAEKSGVPLVVIRNIIRVGKCRVSHLVMIAEAMGCSIVLQPNK